MINVSSGTAGVLGLSKIKQKAPPTTAYLMLGMGCTNSCKFCSQSKESISNHNKLSRVDWISYDENEVFEQVGIAYAQNKIKRLCLQVVTDQNSIDKTFSIVEKIKNEWHLNIPVCSSIKLKEVHEAKRFFEVGMDRLCVAIDAASSQIYNKIKGNDFLDRLNLLTELSKKFTGKITTHLIVGLGESEMEMAEMIGFLNYHKITVALFAFTPVKGTEMEKNKPPKLSTYRKAQIINYLMQKKYINITNIIHEDGIIKGFVDQEKMEDLFSSKLREILINANGFTFMTSGCPDCNRPYYNEKTGEIPYNYPLRLTKNQNIEAINTSGLFAPIKL
jgi:biotin synthase